MKNNTVIILLLLLLTVAIGGYFYVKGKQEDAKAADDLREDEKVLQAQRLQAALLAQHTHYERGHRSRRRHNH
jgi:flagellar basal body-associated protein FliL